MQLVACYGSLKTGHYNHGMLGEDKELLGTAPVNGVMYSNGSYPKLYKVDRGITDLSTFTSNEKGEIKDGKVFPFTDSESRNHVVEIYRINDHAFNRINRMEEGAGYAPAELETDYGPAIIYWMPHENFDDADTWIENY